MQPVQIRSIINPSPYVLHPLNYHHHHHLLLLLLLLLLPTKHRTYHKHTKTPADHPAIPSRLLALHAEEARASSRPPRPQVLETKHECSGTLRHGDVLLSRDE